MKQQLWVWIVWWYMIDWFDLPTLTTFTTGEYSFCQTTSLSLSSRLIDNWLITLIFLICRISLLVILRNYHGTSSGHHLSWEVFDYHYISLDLPSLETVSLGIAAFCNAGTVVFEGIYLYICSMRSS